MEVQKRMNILPNKWYKYFLFKGGNRKIVIALVCLVVSAFLGAYGPHLLVELGEALSNRENVRISLFKLGMLYVMVCINRIIYQCVSLSYVASLIERIRSLCYDSWVLNHDIQTEAESKSNSDRYPLGEVIARIMGDTDAFRELVTTGTLSIFIDIFFVVSCFVSFIYLNVFVGGFLLVAELMGCVLLYWGSKKMRKIFMEVRNARGQIFRSVGNIVGGIRESYYTENGHYAVKKGSRAFGNFLNKATLSNVYDATYYSFAESLYPMFLVLLLLLQPYSNIGKIALMFAIIDLIQRSIEPLKGIASKMANVQRALTGLERVGDFLESLKYIEKDKIVEKGSQQFDEMRVHIEKFSYGKGKDSFGLNNISFSARRGQLIGIVGMSGSGKSTLLNIMAARIIPQKTEIALVSHQDDRLSLTFSGLTGSDSYRCHIGVVSQESHIFSESVLFNVSFEQKSTKEFQLFWEWVSEKIPYLEQWGITPESVLNPKSISLGQRQLVAAIRACYLKKSVILFDEISSGLDSSLEEALREVILLVQKESITFVVAHRIETVLSADRILLLEEGTVVSSGTHGELSKNSNSYQDFILALSQ